jgi:prepilin-type processing-associated H-X9-DG protein
MIDATYNHATYGIGNRWTNGDTHHTSFFTILPPNSVSCIRGSNHDWSMPAASSYHTGGVNAAFVDGSVRFITETIDHGAYDVQPMTVTGMNTDAYGMYGGESLYGVWGALGTAAAGETKAAP